MLKLVIGNRNYSSWSLRAWLYLSVSGIEFEEQRIPIFGDDHWREHLARYTPAGRVPVLVDGELRIWDTLAIIGHLRDTHDAAIDWPKEPVRRAHARSISCEMHAGFLTVRDALPQNLRLRRRLDPKHLSTTCAQQIKRIDEIWSDARRRYANDGSWLFGTFGIADVMFAPVALRFLTYGIELSAPARAYVDTVAAQPDVRRWIEAAKAETEKLEFIDSLTPAAESPLVLG